MSIQVPRLKQGQGYKGPEFFGCFNTGVAPSIFHSHTGKYVVGPELRCRDTMRAALTLTSHRVIGAGRDRVWLFKGRGPAVSKFLALCGAVIMENADMARKYAEARAAAARGDIGAALSLGDF